MLTQTAVIGRRRCEWQVCSRCYLRRMVEG